MTKVEIALPDQLVEEATAAGLLSADRIEGWLQEQLDQRKRIDQLFTAMDRMADLDPEPMTHEEIAEELAAMRQKRRNQPFV